MIQSQFEHRLLVELRQVVAERPAPEVVPLPQSHRSRPLLFGGTATAAAAAAAALLTLTSGGVAPAFAVDRQTNGDVSVRINQLSDAQGLQSQLRAAGINAEVDYTPAGKACRQPRGRTAPPSNGGPGVVGVRVNGVNGGSSTFTISRNMVGPGQTLVIATSGGTGPTSVGMQVIDGPVSSCVLVDAPGMPAGPVFSTHGQHGGSSAGPVTSGSQPSGPQLNRVP
jgi:hypothetical protein